MWSKHRIQLRLQRRRSTRWSLLWREQYWTGIWWWKNLQETGTLLLESEFDTELICFSLQKVDDKDHIPEADIHRVVNCL